MNIFYSVLLAFLPRRYRQSFTHFEVPAAGAVIGGLLESFLALGLFIHRYFAFVNERMAQLPTELLLKAAEKKGESAIMSYGGFLLIEYLLHISTMLLIFFMLEGLVRVIAAIASRETVPTLPLKLSEYADAMLSAQQKERSMGSRLRDEVVIDPSGESLRIASCRPKQWNQLTTIAHEDQLYEHVSQQKATPPRPFVYLLRKKPPTAVIRGIYAYDPNEALQGKK